VKNDALVATCDAGMQGPFFWVVVIRVSNLENDLNPVQKKRNIHDGTPWNSGLNQICHDKTFFSKPLSWGFCICFGLNSVSGSIVRKRQKILEWSRLMMHNKRPLDRTCLVWTRKSLQDRRYWKLSQGASENHFDAPFLQIKQGKCMKSWSVFWFAPNKSTRNMQPRSWTRRHAASLRAI
jgi:hypothetical protein